VSTYDVLVGRFFANQHVLADEVLKELTPATQNDPTAVPTVDAPVEAE
jgi:hypothetical protein